MWFSCVQWGWISTRLNRSPASIVNWNFNFFFFIIFINHFNQLLLQFPSTQKTKVKNRRTNKSSNLKIQKKIGASKFIIRTVISALSQLAQITQLGAEVGKERAWVGRRMSQVKEENLFSSGRINQMGFEMEWGGDCSWNRLQLSSWWQFQKDSSFQEITNESRFG
jgi:hypothetical protein